MPRIDLLLIGKQSESMDWPLGEVRVVAATPKAVGELLEQYQETAGVDAVLVWDHALGEPDPKVILEATNHLGDVWHAGLKLGTGRRPDLIDFVAPTWMLNRDPAPEIEATSWRISFRCCLIMVAVLRQMGGVNPDFKTLEVAALEMGFRFIRNGVFVRHLPGLVSGEARLGEDSLPIEDQVRFLWLGFGKKWALWGCLRAMLTGSGNLRDLVKAWNEIHGSNPAPQKMRYRRVIREMDLPQTWKKVSVLIPTINRYPYLRTLLGQLRDQTVKPYEIIVVDQSPQDARDLELPNEFQDLPVRWFYMDQAGQCRSRNLGLSNAKGDFILFIDDDDEIQPNLIEKHLTALEKHAVRVSSGVAIEDGIDELPVNFQICRISDVFPTNNTLIDRAVLEKSGLFDLAYDHGQRADGDLGMRIYLSGEMMVLNPDIPLIHHHAPQGGLREHKARVNTYASSRKEIAQRVLTSVSELYLAKRYFSPRQLRELTAISLLGTFSVYGGMAKKFLKALLSTVFLLHSVMLLRQRERLADMMLHDYPQIAVFNSKQDN